MRISSAMTTGNITSAMGYCFQRNSTVICNYAVSLPFDGPQLEKIELISTVINIMVNFASSIFAIVGNGSICYVILTKHRFQAPSYVLIAGLALTDLLNGLLVQPLYMATLIGCLYRKPFCGLAMATYYLSYLCGSCSLLTLLIITMERWLAVLFPFIHSSFVTNRKCCYSLTAFWIWSSVTTLIAAKSPFYSRRITEIWTAAQFGIILIAILICYTMVYVVIKRKRRMENQSSKKKRVSPSDASQQRTCETREQTRKKRSMIRKLSWKNKYIVGLIIFALLICYLPKSAERFLRYFVRNQCILQRVLDHWLNTLVLLNSSLNVLIYSFRDKQLLMVIPIFRKFCRRN